MDGCRGEAGVRCLCRRDQEGALDTAIAAARSDPMMALAYAGEAQAVSEPST